MYRLQANFEERLRKQLNLTEIIHLEDKEDEAEEELLPLITSEMKKAISKAMMNSTEVSHHNTSIFLFPLI